MSTGASGDTPNPTEQPEAVAITPRSVWRSGWVIVGGGLCVFALAFTVARGGQTIFVLVLATFLAIAMEPLVSRLTRWMKRPAATGVVLAGILLAAVVFVAAFGSLLVHEVERLIEAAPGAVEDIISWVNSTFGTSYKSETLLDEFKLTPRQTSDYAGDVSNGVFSLAGGIASGVFNAFAILMFTAYISSSMPALRHWIASLFTPARQPVVLTIMEVFVSKVGGYVSARVILAICSATAHSIVMIAIGMPYWLALGLWVGVVSAFIPTVGTYIAITLPTIVGLTSDRPIIGLIILAFAIIYQQFENLILEPRVSSRAVDVHPAISFGSVLLGAQLFGAVGGLLAVPVAATLSTLFDLYSKRYEISPEAEATARAAVTGTPAKDA